MANFDTPISWDVIAPTSCDVIIDSDVTVVMLCDVIGESNVTGGMSDNTDGPECREGGGGGTFKQGYINFP